MSFPSNPATDFHPFFKSHGELDTTLGPVKPGDTDMDPASKMNADTGLDLSAVDYVPKYYFRTVIVKGGVGGQTGKIVRIYLKSGSYYDWGIEISANQQDRFDGVCVGIDRVATTASFVIPCI
jgi:hypothetical protein